MTIETDLRTFLAEPDTATPAKAMARAAALDLILPEACQAGVFDNLDLLRRQARLFVDAVPADAAKPFAP